MAEMTAQLKALAEAASGWEWLCDDPGCGCREAMEAFQKEATPERILALIAENERADKLLQQALEALTENSDLVRNEYDDAVKLYKGMPTRKARLNSMLAELEKYNNTILSIRTYLEGKK